MRVNWKSLMGIALLCLAVGAVAVDPSFGQRPSRGGRGGPGPPGGDRRFGPGPPGGESRPGRGPGGRGDSDRSGDEESRRSRYEGFLRYLDPNGDGRIDEKEVDDRRRSLVERIAERAGIEVKFPISVSQLQERLVNPQQGTGSSSTPSAAGGSAGGPSKASSQKPLVPGFGVEKELAAVLQFGAAPSTGGSRSASRPSSRSDSRNRPSSSRGGSEGDDRMRQWAEGMFRQQDRNHNGRLEKDEWEGIRGDPSQMDSNHDGVITLDEMAARLNEFRRGRSGDRPEDSSKSAESDSDKSERRKSYRFLRPTERLPDGLPDWFLDKDADGDGQVAMAEYATSWSTSVVSKFAGYDLNRDGIITPGECLKAEEDGPAAAEQGKEPAGNAGPERRDRRIAGPGRRDSRTAGPERRDSRTAGPERQDGGGVWDGF